MMQDKASSANMNTSREWNDISDQLAQLQIKMEVLAADRPLDLAEGSRYLARLLESGLAKFNGRPRPAIDYETPRIGGFNPDYRFGHARINPAQSYRLRGTLNDAHRLSLGTYLGPFGIAQPVGHLNSDHLQCDSSGNFEIVLSDVAPENTPGQSWLQKSPQTTSLMVRQLLLHKADQPAELSLEVLDSGKRFEQFSLTIKQQQDNMAGVLLFVAGAANRFFRWTEIFSQMKNTIEHVPTQIENEVKADPDTFYAIGYFELADNERLEVQVTAPECDYWGLQTTNHWLEPLEHDSVVCHRNHATSKKNTDGSFTLSISPISDSRTNTLHTLGHHNGAIFFRVVGANKNEVTLPICTVYKHQGVAM